MTKDVMLTIRGLQFDQGPESEEIETIQWGQYYEKNGYRHIIWDDGAYVFCIYTSLNEDDAFKTAETIREIDKNE